MYNFKVHNPHNHTSYRSPEEFDTKQKAINAGMEYVHNRYYHLSEFETVEQVTDNITLIDDIFEIKTIKIQT